MGAQGVMDVYTTLDQVKAGVAALAAEPEDLYLEVEAAKPAATASAWYKADAKKHGYVNEPWYYGPVSRELAEDLAVRAAPGGFLVRVSTKRTKQAARRYAITVSVGSQQFMHIGIELLDDGRYRVDDDTYRAVGEIVQKLTTTKYKGVIALGAPIATASALAANTATAGGDEPEVAPAPPPRRPALPARNQGMSTGPAEPRRPGQYLVPGRTIDFNSDHIYASTVSSDEETSSDDEEGAPSEPAYESPAAAALGPGQSTRRRRKSSMIPLPDRIEQWTAAEVQRWLKVSGLQAFKKPFYANGITGVELLKIDVTVLPSKRYNQAQKDLFKASLEAQKTKSKNADESPTQKAGQRASTLGMPPPAPPPRAFRPADGLISPVYESPSAAK